MSYDCCLDVSCECPDCQERRKNQKSDKERIAELESENEDYLENLGKQAERVSQLERIIGWFMPEEINGYNFDKLLVDAKEGLKKLGGWQNCYALSAILAARENARQELKSSAPVRKAVNRFHKRLAETEDTRQETQVTGAAQSDVHGFATRPGDKQSPESGAQNGGSGVPGRVSDQRTSESTSEGHLAAGIQTTVQACCEVCGWKPGIPNTDCPEDACRMKQAADQDTSIDRSIDHNTTVVNREQDAQATPETDISKPTCQPGRHTGGSK